MGQARSYQPVTKWGRTTEPILLRRGRSGKGDRLGHLMCFGQAECPESGGFEALCNPCTQERCSHVEIKESTAPSAKSRRVRQF